MVLRRIRLAENEASKPPVEGRTAAALTACLSGLRRQWRGESHGATRWNVKSIGFSLLFLAGTAATSGSVIFAGGGWAAIDRGTVCEALTRSTRMAPNGKVQAIAGLSFTPDHRRWGEFHARLSRTPRPGSSVMMSVGGQPFLLVARGNDAWSRGPLQEQAIMTAVRTAGEMRVEARDLAGSRFADPYSLDGAPTAIDAAAARCAGKKQ